MGTPLGVLLHALRLAALLTLSTPVLAQFPTAGPITIDQGSPQLHLVKSADPVYPPIARAAHVSGAVKLELQIGPDGHVTGSRVLSGPPMLNGSAQEAVKQWVYDPVLSNGSPAATTTTVTLHFNLAGQPNPKDQKIAAQFFPLQQACSRAVSTNSDPAQQAQSCQKAADVAETFGQEERFIERRSAFVYAATALRRNKQSQESLTYAEKAVAVVEQGHDDGSGSASAYGVRAQAEGALGDLPKASDDLTKAEDYERSAIAKLSTDAPDLVKREYVPTLKGLLKFHAQVLAAMGQKDAAEVKTDEAEKL